MTAPPTVWEELTSIADAAAEIDRQEQADRRQLVVRLDTAIARTRELEAELEEIRDELEALT